MQKPKRVTCKATWKETPRHMTQEELLHWAPSF